MKLFLLVSLGFSCLMAQAVATPTKRECEELTTVRDNEIDSVKPKIIYFDGATKHVEISCGGQDLGVVELVSNQGSLGVIEDGSSHKAICRLGRWYSFNKHQELAVIKEVACLVHI